MYFCFASGVRLLKQNHLHDHASLHVLPSSVPQVKLLCSGEGRFRGVAVSESRGNTSRSVESGSDSLTVSGGGKAGELRHLLRLAGRQLMQEFPFCTQTQFAQVLDLLH